MKFEPKHILVPVAVEPEEDIELARYAVSVSCDLAEKFNAHLTIFHLTQPINPGASASIDMTGSVYETLLDVLQERLKRDNLQLEELKQIARARNIDVQSTVLDSLESTAQVICDTSVELGADLIVVVTHGRKGLSLLLMGSVAERVVHLSTVPVLFMNRAKK